MTSRAIKQHTIGFAYASSIMSREMKKAGTGAYYYQSKSTRASFDTYAEALEYARKKRTEPSRWSLDHPANSTLTRGRA